MAGKNAIALGYFDSVHYGHRKIIGETVAYAAAQGLRACVFTFKSDVYAMFGDDSRQIYTFAERSELLSAIGVDDIIAYDFDRLFMNRTPEEFFALIMDHYDPACLFCGYDYRFGRGGSGDTALLGRLCDSAGIGLKVIDKIELGGVRVSSSLIKALLKEGETEKANAYLIEPFSISGEVVRGRGEGHLYDFPTANLLPPPDKLRIKDGVYATVTLAGGRRYVSATSVGPKPTFGDYGFSVETLLEGFAGNLYGQRIKVYFYKYLRGIARFDAPERLRAQIQEDLNYARKYLADRAVGQ